MLVIRIMRGITDHLPQRITDWIAAGMIANIGYIIMGPKFSYSTSTFYNFLANIGSELVIGAIILIIGAVRLASLFVNGTFPAFRWSPHIRFLCAVFSCLVWFQLALGVELYERVTMSVGIYKYLLLLDIYNAFLAASEAGTVERVRRGASTDPARGG